MEDTKILMKRMEIEDPISSNKKFYKYSFDGLMLYIKEDKDAKKIILLLIFNLSFTIVEFLFGFWANSLSLITDSAHMLFDSASLAIGRKDQ